MEVLYATSSNNLSYHRICQEFIAKFDSKFEHKQSRANQATNSLSWKSKDATLCMLAHLQASKLSGTREYQRTSGQRPSHLGHHASSQGGKDSLDLGRG